MTVGTAVYSGGVYFFTAPNRIAPGGLVGLATILHDCVGTPIGTVTAAVNIPLLFIGARYLGKRFLYRTLFATLFSTLLLDILFPFLPCYQGDLLIAALYGGGMIGLGMGLVFLADGSTGGMDIVNQLLRRKFPQISLGMLVFLGDALVVLLAAVIYRDVQTALYAGVTVFLSSRVIDTVLYGFHTGKLAFIISRNSEEIARAIGNRLHRGTTLLSDKGGYLRESGWLVLCACRSREVVRLKNLVYRIDPQAFCVVTEATEVLGQGFSLENIEKITK